MEKTSSYPSSPRSSAPSWGTASTEVYPAAPAATARPGTWCCSLLWLWPAAPTAPFTSGTLTSSAGSILMDTPGPYWNWSEGHRLVWNDSDRSEQIIVANIIWVSWRWLCLGSVWSCGNRLLWIWCLSKGRRCEIPTSQGLIYLFRMWEQPCCETKILFICGLWQRNLALRCRHYHLYFCIFSSVESQWDCTIICPVECSPLLCNFTLCICRHYCIPDWYFWFHCVSIRYFPFLREGTSKSFLFKLIFNVKQYSHQSHTHLEKKKNWF